ncbi:TetR/AcrR family transcriptional regulator [Streptomyces indicus]|uniref:DNA-binding transcriptional regulator, AcrR family n=1 Tax=Streptomyces indicus TaxID=417292 RepID=A0A1G8TEL0_9ACTN|nr:TetR/AcrR family transcriptional regulator [Streptomyces indicus]SDJ39837.1 DNA-binding transcriptional regulator, AcrR family [Streptomyces indicus]
MSERRRTILEAAVRTIARSGVRGLRVEEVAAEAGVSTSLLYYHFKDRAGLVRSTLEFVNDRVGSATDPGAAADPSPRGMLEHRLLAEIQDTPAVREDSTAWGELRAAAVFEPGLRETLARSTGVWVEEIAADIETARRAGQVRDDLDPQAAAERLTALVEGLSERWLSGSLTQERASALLRGAIELELGPHSE